MVKQYVSQRKIDEIREANMGLKRDALNLENETALRGQDLAMQKASMDDATTRRGQTAAYGLKRMELGSQNPLLMGGVNSMRSALDSDMFGTPSVTAPTRFGLGGATASSLLSSPSSVGTSSLMTPPAGSTPMAFGAFRDGEWGMSRGGPAPIPSGPVIGDGPRGVDDQRVSVHLADGEYVLPPQTAQALGGPRALNQLVRSTTGQEPGAVRLDNGRVGLSRGGSYYEARAQGEQNRDAIWQTEYNRGKAAAQQGMNPAVGRGEDTPYRRGLESVQVRQNPPTVDFAALDRDMAPGGALRHRAEAGLTSPNGYAITRQGSEQTRMLNEQGMNNTLAVSPGAFRDAQVLYERSNGAPVDTRQTGIPQVASNALPGSTARAEQSQRPMSISEAPRALTQQAAPPREVSDIPAVPGTWAASTPTEQRTDVARQAQNPRPAPAVVAPPSGPSYGPMTYDQAVEASIADAKSVSANARNAYNSESPILRRGNVFTNDPTWQPYVENAGATQSLGAAYTGAPRAPREPTARERMEQNIRFQPYDVQVAMRAQFDQQEQARAHERAQQQLVNDSYLNLERVRQQSPENQILREQFDALKTQREAADAQARIDLRDARRKETLRPVTDTLDEFGLDPNSSDYKSVLNSYLSLNMDDYSPEQVRDMVAQDIIATRVQRPGAGNDPGVGTYSGKDLNLDRMRKVRLRDALNPFSGEGFFQPGILNWGDTPSYGDYVIDGPDGPLKYTPRNDAERIWLNRRTMRSSTQQR